LIGIGAAKCRVPGNLPSLTCRKHLHRPEALNALVLRNFLSRCLDLLFLYWLIKAVNTQRLERAASRVLRAFTFLIAIILLSTTRVPLPWLLPPALAGWLLALLAGSCRHHRRPAVRRLGARARRQKREPPRRRVNNFE
jgi:hypothetical protein